MAAQDDVIVSFDAPPVVEVVTSVKFDALSPALFLSFGSFWRDAWSSEFPSFELQGPYEVPQETFSTPGKGGGSLEFQFQQIPPLPRVWMTSADGQHVLQMQHDWFAANWRRHPARDVEATYDRWASRRASFLQRWSELTEWIQARGEQVKPSQCEVTYINHIRPVQGIWGMHGDVSRVFAGLGLPTEIRGSPEQIAWRSQHVLAPTDDLPAARLHVTLSPGFAGPGPEPDPVYILELTVRGAPSSSGDLGSFGDRARRAIVESFLGITSAELRKAWGQG